MSGEQGALKSLFKTATSTPEDLATVQELVKNSPEIVSQVDDDGRSAFHWACAVGHLKIAEFLYHQDRDIVGKCDEGGWTALHSASSAGHGNIVSFLLGTNMININAQTNTGGTALHYAASKGHVNIIRLLVNAKADTDIRDMNGFSPIGKSVSSNEEEAVDVLIARGAKLDMKEKATGDNLLHIAVNNHAVDIGALLFKASPSLASEVNMDKKSPADLATTTELLEWKALKEGSK